MSDLDRNDAADLPSRSDTALTASEPTAPAPRSRKSLALAALVLTAVVALGAAGYALWQWPQAPATDTDTAQALAAAEASLAQAAGERASLAQQVQALAAETGALRQRLQRADEERAALRSALGRADGAPPPPPSGEEWRLAEVDYLLRIANRRLAMERDAAAALDLLEAADAILRELDDFALHEVRSLLAAEQLALKTFQGADVQGVFLRLAGVEQALDALPLRLPEYVSAAEVESPDQAATPAPRPPAAGAASAVAKDAADSNAGPDADGSQAGRAAAVDAETDADSVSLLGQLATRFGGLVRLRRHDEAALRPLLGPEQADYVEQHLRLAVHRAQLAALRGDQRIYETSLDAAEQWLRQYVDLRHSATSALAEELDALRSEDLEAELPDISGSLRRLREIELRRAAAPPSEADPPASGPAAQD